MKHILSTMAIAIAMISVPAFAANSNSNANSGSTSGASSISGGGAGGQGGAGYAGATSGAYAGGSASGAYSGGSASGAQINIGGGAAGDGTAAGVSGGTGDNVSPFATKIQFGNSEGSDLGDTVPSVFAAGVTAGGSNPCVVSVGGGASWSGAGFNLARAYNDGECQIRESLRLMVAILPNNSDVGSQMLIRETACQSDVYWQSMERVYMKTKDERFLCTNPRPDNKPIAIRDRAAEKVETTATLNPVKSTEVVSNYNSHPFLDF